VAEDDLNELVSELNQRATPLRAVAASRVLEQWLQQVRGASGSDLLLVAGVPPMIKATGRLVRASDTVLDGEDIETAVFPYVPAAGQSRYRAGEAVDFAFRVSGLGRFRVNLHRERGRTAVAIRVLPTRLPRLADLQFTHDIGLLARLPRGLVLVAGPTGSGKTTTLAALVSDINHREQRHVVTIEDPIEYEHPHGTCVVEQVEIGIDAPDFPTALRSALRQAPEVLVIGELRDTETMRIALSAAETGHLVFATVHATDVGAAVSRIADAFPSERQNAVRQELAMALAAVLTQTLVISTAGALAPVAELLIVGYGARQHVRKNALQHLHQEITISRKAGSFTLEESLAKLVQEGLLDRKEAAMRAAHPDELESILGRS
jgi:twitching motility protein PilT